MEVGGGELLLHFETTHPGQIHVEHETAGHFVPEPVEEVPRGRERLDPEVRRVDQALDGFTDRDVVVDHVHGSRCVAHGHLTLPATKHASGGGKVHCTLVSAPGGDARWAWSDQRPRRAKVTASSRAVSLNGFRRHSIAPAWSICGRMLLSPWAVMKMIGIVLPRCDSSCWRAGPLMPGMATSTTRQSVWSTNSEARNSAAEEKARDAKPNVLSRSGRDSRTDSSSSTTDTSGALGTRFSHHELPVVDDAAEVSRHVPPSEWVRADG